MKIPRQIWGSEAHEPMGPQMAQKRVRREAAKSMIQIPVDIRDRLKPELQPGEEPAIVIRTAADKRGDIGECWSIITPQNWFILNKPLARDVIVSKYPLSVIARAEVKRDPYGRAECSLWGLQTVLDKIRFSSLDLKTYEEVNEKLQALKGAPLQPAPAEVPHPRREQVEEAAVEEEPLPFEPTEPERRITLKDLFTQRSLEDLFGQPEAKKEEHPTPPISKSPAQKSTMRNIALTIFYLLLIAVLSYFLNKSRSP